MPGITKPSQLGRDAGRSIIGGGGGGHIFICYAQLISFEIEIKILKSIVFTVCEQEYMNMCPPPPPPIIDLPASLQLDDIVLPGVR